MAQNTQWVFGFHAVESLLSQKPELVLNLFFAEFAAKGAPQKKPQVSAKQQTLLDKARQAGIHVEFVPSKTIEKWVGDQVHQGVVAEVRNGQALDEHDLDKLICDADQHRPLLFLALDQITDPHNLGACLRVAAAAGADGVILPKDKSAQISPIVRKVASGAVDLLSIFLVTNLARALTKAKEQNVWVLGTLLDDGAKSLYSSDLKRNIIMVMGAEGEGMRKLTRDLCDELIYIPMAGTIQSLNVSVATGLCLFEAVRQRDHVRPITKVAPTVKVH